MAMISAEILLSDEAYQGSASSISFAWSASVL